MSQRLRETPLVGMLPSNEDLERLVLGAILMKGSVGVAAGLLDEYCFSNLIYREIWWIMEALHREGTPVDRITVFKRAKDHGKSAITLTQLVDLDEQLPDVVNLDTYLAQLKDIGIRREAIFRMELLAASLADTRTDSAQLLGEAAQVNAALSSAGKQDEGVVCGVDAIKQLGGLDALLSPERIRMAIPTPWGGLQTKFPGFQPGKLVLLAGRPGEGKTALALQAAYHAAHLGHPVLFTSMEMPKAELLNRVLAQGSKVFLSNIARGYVRKQDVPVLGAVAASEGMRYLFFSDDVNVSVPLLRNRIMKMATKPKLVVVDYLQLMSTGTQGTRNDQVASISRGLKLLAMELEVCILALSQMSRPDKAAAASRKPQLSDLRDSGSLEQDADVVWFIWGQRTPEDPGDARVVVLLMAKHRNGATGGFPLTFHAPIQRFEDEFTQAPWKDEFEDSDGY